MSCYGLAMTHRAALVALLCLPFGLVAAACSGDDGASSSAAPTARVCNPDEVFGVPLLDPLEPCSSDDQCSNFLCFHGRCAETCIDNDDCIPFGDLDPTCEYIGPRYEGGPEEFGCVYYCHGSDSDCPNLTNECVYQQVPSGTWENVCETNITLLCDPP